MTDVPSGASGMSRDEEVLADKRCPDCWNTDIARHVGGPRGEHIECLTCGAGWKPGALLRELRSVLAIGDSDAPAGAS